MDTTTKQATRSRKGVSGVEYATQIHIPHSNVDMQNGTRDHPKEPKAPRIMNERNDSQTVVSYAGNISRKWKMWEKMGVQRKYWI